MSLQPNIDEAEENDLKNNSHKTGIPYNPQEQGTVECAHSSLKTQLQKINTGELYPQVSHNVLNHALFTLNFLNTDVPE